MKRPLPDLLRNRIAADPPGAICVGFSGGPDSTALLHALAQLPEARHAGLRALHVDHGLHADSAAWARHCAAFCARIDVPLTAVRVTVKKSRGDGIEAAARRARYAAFAGALHHGEWLAVAHHRDDQIETVLLKLLRGAGPEGLGGMRRLRPFAGGSLWRPLLDVPRTDLRAYLATQHLDAIDDPANHDPGVARNVVRDEVLPLLQRYWPHAGTSLLHSAGLCRDAADHLAAEARIASMPIQCGDDTLDATGWLALSGALRGLVLDQWLHAAGLPAPTDAARRELQHQTGDGRADTVPQVRWPGAEVRVWDGRLFALRPLADPPGCWHAAWDGSPLELPAGCGALTLIDASGRAAGARLDPPLTIRLRRGGERIRPAGDAHTRELRDLFQRARIPPWLRSRCPLLFSGDDLIAVADLWASARGLAIFKPLGLRVCWSRPEWAGRGRVQPSWPCIGA